MTDTTVGRVSEVVAHVLELDVRTLDADTRLFGALPELDSLAVLELIAALEDRFGFVFDPDDVSGDAFESIGTLAALVDSRL
ncbi:acyl carrier protein [Microbacterium ulmi]|uniref:Acyl carrier protein n=1 Tax=Microbacterium ulmi TaxID=179095 RepID=A0A7Y2LZA9_9MICO|nr:acyl carrier protein [Microbacterium ulmi]NII69723.1 acyl carrier protein [Microbacterium ulmi]NNH03302.1 acyl carrier protein [Microbacterium ulmi]